MSATDNEKSELIKNLITQAWQFMEEKFPDMTVNKGEVQECIDELIANFVCNFVYSYSNHDNARSFNINLLDTVASITKCAVVINVESKNLKVEH